MNPKTVVILLVVLVCSLVILTSPKFMTPSGGKRYDASQDVPAIPEEFLSSKLTRISFPVNNGALDLNFRNGRWWINLPHTFPASTQKVNELLQRISGVSVTPPGKSIEEATPNPPQPVYLASEDEFYLLRPIRRMGAGRTSIEVANQEGEKLYNANKALHEILDNLNPAAFYASSPEPLLLPDLARIEITADSKTSTLQQQDGIWWIGDPNRNEPALEQGLPDAPGVSTYLELHNNLKLSDPQFYPTTEQGLGGFGLDRPLITAVFTTQTNDAWRLQVGVPADPEDKTRYVSYGPNDSDFPAVFTLDTQIAITFGQDASLFRDPRVMTIPRSLIGSLVIKNRRGHYTIRFMPNGIQFVTSGPDFTPDVTPQETNEGEILAQLLSKTRAIDYVTRDITDVKPVASVVIHPRLDGEQETLTIYPDTNETVLIRRNDEQTLLKVERTSIQMLLDRNFSDSSD